MPYQSHSPQEGCLVHHVYFLGILVRPNFIEQCVIKWWTLSILSVAMNARDISGVAYALYPDCINATLSNAFGACSMFHTHTAVSTKVKKVVKANFNESKRNELQTD